MMNIFTKTYPAPPFDKCEILRYSGTKESNTQIEALMNECIEEVAGVLSYKVCYVQLPLDLRGGSVDLSFTKTDSEDLKKVLEGCHSVILFAATTGIETDRLITKYTRISPSKALMFQAIGTERIEKLCDEFCLFAEAEYGHTTMRFSAGYGDLPLEFQKEIFGVLDPARKIGVTLNNSLVMSPSKSVTAIVGISDCEESYSSHDCSKCNKTNCLFRREQ